MTRTGSTRTCGAAWPRRCCRACRVLCVWLPDVLLTRQVAFHVATLMPTHAADPQCVNKILHINNDFVTIVYNDRYA